MTRKELGKIKSIDFTVEDSEDGYVIIALGGEIWSVCAHETISAVVDRMKHCGVSRLRGMKNLPVEVVFDRGSVESWRVLVECL